jgi:hypothetical protein
MGGALSVLGWPGMRVAAADAYTHAMHVALWSITTLMILGTVTVAVLTRPPRPAV